MRLAFTSLVLFTYVAADLIWPLPLHIFAKVLVASLFFIISLKYIIYIKIGGSFIAPDLPRPVLLVMEFSYSALIILIFLLLFKDILALLLWLSRLSGGSWQLPFTSAIRGLGLLTTALILSWYGTRQALRVPDVHSVEITLPMLPSQLDGFVIAQLSDLHIGLLLKGPWLKEVVARTNDLAPDLVVLTGDMIDGSSRALQEEVVALSNLKARYGVYGVTGNHEYYFDVDQWTATFNKLGIIMLNNDYRTFSIDGGDLVLVGVTDRTARRSQIPGSPIETLWKNLPAGVRVLLQHRPSGAPINERVDLQLSGHTHGGNLFFLKWLIASFNGGLVEGLFHIDGKQLYVSPGTGIWAGFSCRLGVPAEITRIILRSPIEV